MANLDTGSDLLAWFLRRCGELFPNDTVIANADRIIDAKLHLNQQYLQVCASRPYRWARKDPPRQFVSVAKQAVTMNSVSGAAVTLAATIATSQAGRKFYLEADGIPCRIDTHTAGSAVLNLVTAYPGTGTSGAAVIFMDEITVASDILAFPVIRELHTGDDLEVIPEEEFSRLYPRNISDRTRARHAAFVTNAKLRLGPWTTDARLFECAYNYRPTLLDFTGAAATDTPILPQEGRALPGLYALHSLMGDKRDARLVNIEKEIGRLEALLTGAEVSFAKPRTYVRPGARVMGVG